MRCYFKKPVIFAKNKTRTDMKYMGSKNRIAKHILPIMLEHKTDDMIWVEPFVGGANMIDKVKGKRIGADLNEYLIEALKLIRDEPSKIPNNNTEYTKEMYLNAIEIDSKNPVDCFAYFNYSFASRFKSTWAKNKRGTDYVKECVRNIIKQSKNIQGVEFIHSSYQDLEIPNNSLIYCDPPYKGTAGYKDGFNHSEFWEWCRTKRKQGHKVFVSEYNAPEDFKCVKEVYINNNLSNTNNLKSTEKLFTL